MPSNLAEAAGPATVTATLSAVSGLDVTVDFVFSGTAINLTDYTHSSTQIVIAAGSTSGTVFLTAAPDAIDELTESIVIDISNVTNGTESGTQSIIVVVADDNPPPTVALSVSPTSITGTSTITATLSVVSGLDVRVTLSFSGTATHGSDYTRTDTQIVIPAGSLSGTITITVVPDLIDEANETVVVEISDVTNGTTSGTQSIIVVVADDNPPPTVTLSVSPTSITGTSTITATLSVVSGLDVRVTLSFSGTATHGSDYTRTDTQIVIPAGSLSGTITITVVPDTIVEANETVVVDIGDITNGIETGTQSIIVVLVDENRQLNVIVLGAAKSPITPQFVTVLDAGNGAVLARFAPYGNTFQGGVRVATGDLTGDGIDEIITAPGWSIVAQVQVYTQLGGLLTSFQPYGANFNGGVQVAVGDVDGDGLSDIITVPSWGPAEVKVFRNVLVAGVPTFDASRPYRDFLAFPASFIGGAVVAAADMGSTPLLNGSFNNTQDQRAEIVVGSNAGVRTSVKVFDVRGMTTPSPSVMATAARSFAPFSTTNYQGGVSLAVARINADPIADIVVGAGVNGGSLVDVWAWSNTASATLSSLSANGRGFAAFTDDSRTAPVQVAALDTNGDGIADAILAAQGPGGTTSQIRTFNITRVSPLQVSLPTAVTGNFPSPYFIATINNPSPSLPRMAIQPTKFYVVNDGSSDRTFEYVANGTATQDSALSSANTAPRGAVSTAAGDKVWVVDANRQVYVYDANGRLLGSWIAGTLASNATVEGIATNGTDVWIVDARSDRVFKYSNAAGRLSGSQNADSRFNLDSGNKNPEDIVTDGTHFWVVNDGLLDRVFKYTMSGSLVGRWTIAGGGGAPTGITLDPAAPSHLWIVDNNTDRVEQYDNALGRISSSQAASTTFALAAGNTNPQGIADPPPPSSGTAAATQDAALLSLMEELDWLTPARTKRRR